MITTAGEIDLGSGISSTKQEAGDYKDTAT